MASSSDARSTRFAALPGLIARAPAWVIALVGAAAVVLGALLITRPVSALAVLALYVGLSFIVTGVSDALDASGSSTPRSGLLVAGLWVLLGIAVLVWLGRTVDLLGVVVAVALIVGGVIKAVRALRGSVDERVASGIFGVADIIFGVLALQWPDVTLIIVAIVFGARMVFFGIQQVWRAVVVWRGRDEAPTGSASAAEPSGRGWFVRFGRVVAAVAALVIAIAVAGVGSQLRAGAPLVDGFGAPAGDVPDEPGQLLKAEPFERGMPEGTSAWRILYTTTDALGEPALSTGVVFASDSAPAGPRPVVAWSHGTTGFDRSCAPTLLGDPLGSGAMPAIEQVVREGWILVATDYTGLGTDGPHPYLIGPGEAHSVLDSLRAVRQLDDIEASDQSVVWGHSQGGHSALWTGQLAPAYAPELDIVGVAAMSPASDLVGLIQNLPNVPGGSLFGAYVAAAYEAHYDDVTYDAILEPGALRITRELAARCLAEPSIVVSIVESLAVEQDRAIFRGDPTTGAFGDRLRENTPTGPTDIPLLLAQGSVDPLVKPAVQRAFVDQRCATGLPVDYREYEGFEHVDVVGSESPLPDELVAWTTARLAGEEPISTC